MSYPDSSSFPLPDDLQSSLPDSSNSGYPISENSWEGEDQEQVLGLRLLNALGRVFSSLFNPSHTVLRLDLRRPLSFVKPISSDKDKWVDGVRRHARARLQLMQVWDFSEREETDGKTSGSRGYGLNIGFGASIEMDDGGVVVPKARLKTKYATLHVLPAPCFELRGQFPLGISSLGARIRLRIPLNDLEKVWDSAVANLTLDLYNQVGSGFHLTPGGLEFDEHVMKIGKYSTMRVAASINFPRRIPPEEDEQPFKIDVHRIGLKSRII